uniref:Uncharacterized protein n=1 Tax=Haemonchus contortus TaxID=6289 RepID=A0A7I5E8L1_HAECO
MDMCRTTRMGQLRSAFAVMRSPRGSEDDTIVLVVIGHFVSGTLQCAREAVDFELEAFSAINRSTYKRITTETAEPGLICREIILITVESSTRTPSRSYPLNADPMGIKDRPRRRPI